MSMTRKYHIQILQTNPWYRVKETQNTNSHKSSERQSKQSNELSSPQQDDFKKNIADIKYCITKQGSNTNPPQRMEQQLTLNQQQQNYRLERTAAGDILGA